MAQNLKQADLSNPLQMHFSITSDADLAKVTARLDQPATRLQALSELIDFSSMKLYQVGSVFFITGDSTIDALQQQAVKSIRKHADFETVSQALVSPNRTLQFWGVWFWRGGAFSSRDSKPNVWLKLMPKVEKLAVSGDANVRLIALQGLRWYPEAKGFLAERLHKETDCFNVLTLLEQSDTSDTDDLSKQITPFLLRFLNHQDKEVRRQALLFIGSNYLSAPMWQIKFDQSVTDKVIAMTKSGSEEEKKVALYALQGMHEKPG